ncbi:MAG: PilW family protein [Pseudomonadales bacterium]|nr:PilW family protein [Pseudomonadales bacterium]
MKTMQGATVISQDQNLPKPANTTRFTPDNSSGLLADRSSGFTLIELMIALTIGTILISGLTKIFANVSLTYRVDNAIARVQENGRFAADFLIKEFRLIGYQGCIDPETVVTNIIANNPPVTNISQASIRVYEVGTGAWSPTIDPSIADLSTQAFPPIVGSDVITIQRASDLDVSLSGNLTADNANIQISSNPASFAANDLIIITDCESIDLFRATGVSTSGGTVTISHSTSTNSTPSLSKAYQMDAKVMRFYSYTFYVRDTGRDNYAGNPVYALYRRDADGNSVELIEGVANLQLLYGEEIAGGLTRYVPASQAGLDISNIKSIRFGVLIQSKSSSLTANDDATYALPGENIVPTGTSGATAVYLPDQSYKSMFISTVKLRNRR